MGLRGMRGPDPAGFHGHGEYSAVYHKDIGGAVEMCWGIELWSPDQVTCGQRDGLQQASYQLVDSSIFYHYVDREE